MLKEYRKTATIKAEQFDGSEEMMDKYIMGKVKSGINSSHPYVIFTLEGPLGLNIGDYIATGDAGEYWAIADEIFKKTYEEVG